jgi:hypothetical protein
LSPTSTILFFFISCHVSKNTAKLERHSFYPEFSKARKTPFSGHPVNWAGNFNAEAESVAGTASSSNPEINTSIPPVNPPLSESPSVGELPKG